MTEPVTENHPRDAGIDSLLRRSMSLPVPRLPPDFDQRLMRELRHSSPLLDRYRRILLTCYGLISVVTSAVLMRGQGLGWRTVAVMILGPLVLIAALFLARRATHVAMK